MGSRRARYRHTSRVTETRAGPPGATPHTAGGWPAAHTRAHTRGARARPRPRGRGPVPPSRARACAPHNVYFRARSLKFEYGFMHRDQGVHKILHMANSPRPSSIAGFPDRERESEKLYIRIHNVNVNIIKCNFICGKPHTRVDPYASPTLFLHRSTARAARQHPSRPRARSLQRGLRIW